jgi:hypothetical protein
MRCKFEVDDDSNESWTEERDDLPLYPGARIPHSGRFYLIIDGPRYVADWESASISAMISVKRRGQSSPGKPTVNVDLPESEHQP